MNRKRVGAAVVGVAVLALIVGGGWFLLRRSGGEEGALRASGTVEATEADLGFPAGGQVARVAVEEGDPVAAGQVLAQLGSGEIEARKAAAEAQLAAARAALRELENGARPEELAQASAAADAARQQAEEAERSAARASTLYEGGAISREAYEQAITAREVAVARYQQAREQRELVARGPREERVEAQRAAVRQAQALVAQVASALEDAVIRAPFAGVVTVRHREPGETVSPGLPVLTVMNTGDRWVRIYVPEDRVGRVGMGQPARIYGDAYPDSAFAGRVTFIASEAEFTPRNVQTTEERVRLVYAVKVAVTGDPGGTLKPGLPADVVLPAAR